MQILSSTNTVTQGEIIYKKSCVLIRRINIKSITTKTDQTPKIFSETTQWKQ